MPCMGSSQGDAGRSGVKGYAAGGGSGCGSEGAATRGEGTDSAGRVHPAPPPDSCAAGPEGQQVAAAAFIGSVKLRAL